VVLHVTSDLLAVSWKVYTERLAHPGRYSRGFASQIRRPVSMSTIPSRAHQFVPELPDSSAVPERKKNGKAA